MTSLRPDLIVSFKHCIQLLPQIFIKIVKCEISFNVHNLPLLRPSAKQSNVSRFFRIKNFLSTFVSHCLCKMVSYICITSRKYFQKNLCFCFKPDKNNHLLWEMEMARLGIVHKFSKKMSMLCKICSTGISYLLIAQMTTESTLFERKICNLFCHREDNEHIP